MTDYEGVLPVLKPAGFTSHDVVAKVRRILKMKRIGHTGTLDPQVTGVLPLCLGKATRMVEYLQEMPKEYEATLVLGISTDTEDMTGTITAQQVVHVTEEQVMEVLSRFHGVISQVPPMYSAIKKDGKRLYELAREGKVVERKAREVVIHELSVTGMKLEGPHPELSIRVLCSKGTYIRTLCVDIGQALGVPAAMSLLRRTISAGIELSSCLTFEQIAELAESGQLARRLISADEAVHHLPQAVIQENKVSAALQGQRLSSSVIAPAMEEEEPFRLYDPKQRFLGIYKREADSGAIAPIKVFAQNSND